VEDVAALCIKAANAPASIAGKMFNAGNGGRYTLNRVWSLLQKVEGVEIAPVFGPPREGDVRHSMADTQAVTRELEHAPRFTIEQGLERTLEWYRTAATPATHGAA
jgi:nucleoside-diphosphate-sugar epimerase